MKKEQKRKRRSAIHLDLMSIISGINKNAISQRFFKKKKKTADVDNVIEFIRPYFTLHNNNEKKNPK